MKKFAIFALTLVLTTATLVGCGCTNREVQNTSAPTVLPTNEEMWSTTENTTQATTQATQATDSYDHGNGPLDDTGNGTNSNTDSTNTTENTGTTEGNARNMVPGIE